MRRIILSTVIVLLCVPRVSFAEELVLTTGKTMQGKVIEKTDKYVKFDDGSGITVKYYQDEIKTIDGVAMAKSAVKAVVPVAASATVPTPVDVPAVLPTPLIEEPILAEQAQDIVPSPASDVTRAPEVPTIPAGVPTEVAPIIETGELPHVVKMTTDNAHVDATLDTQVQAAPPAEMVNSAPRDLVVADSAVAKASASSGFRQERFKNAPPRPMTAEEKALFMGMLIIVFVMIFVGYLLTAIPLMILSKKMDIGKTWMAWVPIVQWYLSCKLAGRPGWWTLLFFVPLVTTILFVIVWMDIAVARKHPKWMGILMVIPIPGIFLPLYLALTDK